MVRESVISGRFPVPIGTEKFFDLNQVPIGPTFSDIR